jgi:RNA polymerase sigma-70 factor, ECF subfamily
MEELIQRAKADEHQAQQELKMIVFMKIKTTCLRLLKDPNWAEETAEDIWMDFIYQHIQHLERADGLFSYLKTMTVRRCVRLRETQKKHQELSPQHEPSANDEPNLVEQIDVGRQRLKLDRCMGRLKQRDRVLLRMRYFFEMTLDDIGSRNQFSKQYVSKQIERSLMILKRCLESQN